MLLPASQHSSQDTENSLYASTPLNQEVARDFTYSRLKLSLYNEHEPKVAR